MDASSEVIQRFQFFSGNTRLKPSFLALGLLLSLQWRNNGKIPAFFVRNAPFFCVYSYFEKGCREKVHARIPKGIVGCFEFAVPRNFKEWHERPWKVCFRVLKESNKSRFDSYSVNNSVLIMSHITFRDCRLHIFSDSLSRNTVKFRK